MDQSSFGHTPNINITDLFRVTVFVTDGDHPFTTLYLEHISWNTNTHLRNLNICLFFGLLHSFFYRLNNLVNINDHPTIETGRTCITVTDYVDLVFEILSYYDFNRSRTDVYANIDTRVSHRFASLMILIMFSLFII